MGPYRSFDMNFQVQPYECIIREIWVKEDHEQNKLYPFDALKDDKFPVYF